MDIIKQIMENESLSEIEKIEKLSNHFESIGNSDYEIFVKALFMYVRKIDDVEILNQMYETYEKHEMSLFHEEILNQ